MVMVINKKIVTICSDPLLCLMMDQSTKANGMKDIRILTVVAQLMVVALKFGRMEQGLKVCGHVAYIMGTEE